MIQNRLRIHPLPSAWQPHAAFYDKQYTQSITQKYFTSCWWVGNLLGVTMKESPAKLELSSERFTNFIKSASTYRRMTLMFRLKHKTRSSHITASPNSLYFWTVYSMCLLQVMSLKKSQATGKTEFSKAGCTSNHEQQNTESIMLQVKSNCIPNE